MNDLMAYKKNVTSQWGEDGLLEELFARIGVGAKRCIEFGAWDGKHYSNTWKLWHQEDWAAILIESDRERYLSLKSDVATFPKVTAHHALVMSEGQDSLESILDRIAPSETVDLLSIDIDGEDYHIFKSIKKYLPRVLVIEYNPTIPPELDIVQDRGEYFGSSISALCRLAHEKGYKLVALTETNGIFARADVFAEANLTELSVKDVFYYGHLAYVISSYSGALFVSRPPLYRVLGPGPYSLTIPESGGTGALIPLIIKRDASLFKKLWTYKGAGKYSPSRLAEYLKTKVATWKSLSRHKAKQRIIKKYQKGSNYQTFVETGTYKGEMVQAMKETFDQVYSIEISRALFEKACERFQTFKKIHLFCGDSGEILDVVLGQVRTPALFWLDGHYSGGRTEKGELNTPIYKELAAIFRHPVKSHLVLIDDARCFTGKDDYPTVAELAAFIAQRDSGYTLHVEQDILIIKK